MRLQHCFPEVALCSMGVPQGTDSFLFTVYTFDFRYNTTNCHLRRSSDDTSIVGCVSEETDLEYRKVITDFIIWYENHLRINTSKTKEMVIDFQRKAPPITSMFWTLRWYKLGAHLNNKLDWSHNTRALFKKDKSQLHQLERLRSFGMCRTLLRTFYDTMMASAILNSNSICHTHNHTQYNMQ